jgi:hypothetical protein
MVKRVRKASFMFLKNIQDPKIQVIIRGEDIEKSMWVYNN